MATSQAQYSSEEFARRGTEIYDRAVRPALRPDDADKFVAIDIESGAYEMDRDDYAATERLLTRQPHAQIWLARIGQRAAYRIGGARSLRSVFEEAHEQIWKGGGIPHEEFWRKVEQSRRAKRGGPSRGRRA